MAIRVFAAAHNLIAVARRVLSSMSRSISNILDSEFLGIRCRLIELAAALDRIDRAGGDCPNFRLSENGTVPFDSVSGDPRMAQIRRSLEILADDGPNRAEQVQMVFSLPYEKGWAD
jgi:hypothetical protein